MKTSATLTVEKLTMQQGEVFDAIMRDRKILRSEREEVIEDALAIVQRATVTGTLDRELEFWQERPKAETPQLQSSAAWAMKS